MQGIRIQICFCCNFVPSIQSPFKKYSPKKTTFYVILLIIITNISFAQNDASKPIVQLPVYFDVSPPLRDMANNPMLRADNSWKDGIVKNHFNARKNQNKMTFPLNYVDPAIQNYNGPMVVSDTTIQNFEGNSNTQGYDPPDTHGDVGPNNFFQVVNCHYSIYSKPVHYSSGL